MTWNARLRLALLLLTTTVLQVTLFPDLRFFGVAPDLCLVAAIAVAFRAGPEIGAVYGFAAGLAVDLFLQTPFGLSALVFASVAYAVGFLTTGLSRTPRFAAPMFGGLGGLAGGVLFVLIGALAGEEHLFAWRSVWVIAIAAVYDAVLALALFPIARWAAPTDELAVRSVVA
jgi:rod shape-determining protein MreD